MIKMITRSSKFGNSIFYITLIFLALSSNSQSYVPAEELKAGDVILSVDGTAHIIREIKINSLNEQVYNFTVADHHNYFVTESGLLVHNTDCNKGWIKKDIYSELGKKDPELRREFEKAMEKGMASNRTQSGIHRNSGKGWTYKGKKYNYKLKISGKKYGNHRLYGNAKKWKNPKTGEVETIVEFEAYDPKAH